MTTPAPVPADPSPDGDATLSPDTAAATVAGLSEPAGGRPAGAGPAGGEPAGGEPAGGEPATVPPAAGEPHSCEHCAGSGERPDPVARARSHIALAQRRVVPRVVLGLLALGLALVLARRADQSLLLTSVVYAAAALSWLIAAWGGVLLGAVLGGRSPRAQLALGQVFAAALAPLLALAIALTALPLGAPDPGSEAGWEIAALLPSATAAAAGWFLAGALGEVARLRALRGRIAEQEEVGLQARGEAERLTLPQIQRTEVVALAVAVAFGVATAALWLLPWLAVVLTPLAAAGAAWFGLRRVEPSGE